MSFEETIFVTGATGFIGGRVCERLVQAGAKNVRALVHTPHRAARIGRLPIELCRGSLLDRNSLRQAMGKPTVVIHCGLGIAGGIVEGTRNLLEAARESGVKRFVHMSTAAVYGLTPKAGSETEDAPLPTTGDPYCDNKGRAEALVMRFVRDGLPATILRPSIVYGPYSAWSTRLVNELRNHQVTLIDGGRGACNTTYVDNLVDAILLCLGNDACVGQAFFITDGEPITWGDFIQAHVRMLGLDEPLPSLSKEQIAEHYRKQPGMLLGSLKASRAVLRSREFRQLLLRIPATERLLASAWRWAASRDEQTRERIRSRFGVRKPAAVHNGTKAIPDEVTFATQSTTVYFSIEKAKRILHYEPSIKFARGIELVELWLRFANYI